MHSRLPMIGPDLLVISAGIHYERDGRIFAYTPYVRELKIWGELFGRLVIAAPRGDGPIPRECSPIECEHIELVAFPISGGETAIAKLRQLPLVPLMALRIARLCRKAYAIHVRCPGNLGLLGALIAPIFSRRIIAKYAGQWDGYPGESRTTWLQRKILGSRWWRGPVTVYGNWTNQPRHVVSFFTSVLSSQDVERAQLTAADRQAHSPFRLLYVGRLSKAKNVDSVVGATRLLVQRGIPTELRIVGDGPERESLQAQIEKADLASNVTVAGALDFEDVLSSYEWADALVLVSETEGWPKAIAEAMTFGLPCIASNIGLIPSMLAEDRGFVVSPGSAMEVAEAAEKLAVHSQLYSEMGERGAVWGSRYSLDALATALKELAMDRWPLTDTSRVGVVQVIDTLQVGGAESVAVDLANSISREDYASHVCATRTGGDLIDALVLERPALILGKRATVDPLAVFRLARFLRRERIRVVHAHSSSVFMALLAAWFVPGSKIVGHLHSAGPFGNGFRCKIVQMMYRAAWARCWAVISASAVGAHWLERSLGLPSDRVIHIPNPPNPPPRIEGNTPTSSLESSRIVCVANLRPEKDHLTLIRAMKVVSGTNPNARLSIVGSTSDATYLSTLNAETSRLGLNDVVEFTGYKADVHSILITGSIGVLSSSREAFPLALFDYAHAGLCAVATDVGDCSRILDGGKAGLVVPPGDPAALAKAINSLLSQPNLRQELADNLRRRVDDQYNRHAILGRFEKIYLAASTNDRSVRP